MRFALTNYWGVMTKISPQIPPRGPTYLLLLPRISHPWGSRITVKHARCTLLSSSGSPPFSIPQKRDTFQQIITESVGTPFDACLGHSSLDRRTIFSVKYNLTSSEKWSKWQWNVYLHSKVWKLNVFCIIQILREIDFEDSWSTKWAILPHFEHSKFWFLWIFVISQGWNLPK